MALAERDLTAIGPGRPGDPSRRGEPGRRGEPALAAQSVVVVAFPGVMLLDAAQVLEVLTAAGRAVAPVPGYDVLVTSPTGCSVPTSSGVRLGVDAAMREVVGAVDTLVALGGWDQDVTFAYPGLLPHIRRLGDAAQRVTAVANGGHLLRSAGLLGEGRSPAHVSVSGIDLALWMTCQDYGDGARAKVVQWLADCHHREPASGGPPDATAVPVPHDSPLRRIADAVISDPGQDHSVGRLARLACVSERHLNRQVLAEMGMSPTRDVPRVRLEAARAALEHDHKSIETIAAECGFGTAETMRRAFLRALGISPSSYRARSSSCTQC